MRIFQLPVLMTAIVSLIILQNLSGSVEKYNLASRGWEDWPGDIVVVVYAEAKDAEFIKNVLTPIKDHHLLKLILIVDYLGCESKLLSQQITSWKGTRPIKILNKFDSSIYAIMPLAKTPAFYLIDKNKIGRGPIYGPKKFLRIFEDLT